AALAYARRGFPIFPCRADKTPYIAGGVLKATTDPAQIKTWWQAWPAANIALDVGGAGMMVVELDSYKPDFKPEAVAALNLPETLLRQRSPRGGEHLFYALQPGELVAMSAGKLAPGVDVRSFHSYVLLAPSRTADGPYVWESEGKPAFRTDAMVALANTARAKSDDRDNWTIEPDLPENVAAATKWLREDARVAIEGVNGDATAYATAAHLKSFGISEPLALDLMWEHWNPRCSPPWSADQIDHFERKVQNGYCYNTSPPGNITEAYRMAKQSELFKPVELPALPGGRQSGRGRFRFIDREGIDHLEPPSWLVADLLPVGGYGVLVGAWGSFKTFLALDLALTVATGFPIAPT
ncbi:MAG: bifunctional DNA primase/polymerase, partial [Bradyrhizobium sp.]|nr:bifunctional DNA primase/polymerase [Bradyrhizobium sp.]